LTLDGSAWPPDVVVSKASWPFGTEKRKNATPFPTRLVDSDDPSTLSSRVTSGNGVEVPAPVKLMMKVGSSVMTRTAYWV